MRDVSWQGTESSERRGSVNLDSNPKMPQRILPCKFTPCSYLAAKMELNQFTDFALRILIFAALKGDERTSIREIAESYSIS
jgi:hypothetical protein